MAQSETNIRTKAGNGIVVPGIRVLIQPDEYADFKGKIAIPQSVKGEAFPTTGKVVKMGLDIRPEDTPVRVGDRVVFSKYAGIECSFEDGKLIALNVSDVILIVDAGTRGAV